MRVHDRVAVSGGDALVAYLAAEAAWKLRLAPHYRDMAELKRQGATELREFLSSPEGHNVVHLRGVLGVLTQALDHDGAQWDRVAAAAEESGLAQASRVDCGSA